MATVEMVEAKPKPKREIEMIIERLKKVKKKPEDWIFVPRMEKYEKAPVMLADGEYKLLSDGSGGFKTHTTRKAIKLNIPKVRFVDKDGTIHGGYRPQQEADWTPQAVLDALIDLSLNPKCEVVPYEARQMPKAVRDAETGLMEERRKRQDAEEKLKAMEGESERDKARIRELEKMAEEFTKPKK